MKTTSTLIGKITLVLAFVTSITFANAQSSKAKFIGAELTSGKSTQVSNKKIKLYWDLSIDNNTDYFEVERSFDKTNFKTIALVLDALTASETDKQYTFRDGSSEIADQNVVYYRLKQINNEGKYTYSEIKAVSCEQTNNSKLNVAITNDSYSQTVNANVTSDEAGSMQIRFINTAGQVTSTKQTSIDKGYNSLKMNMNSMMPGVYFVDIIMNGKVIDKQKVLKP